jgi:hydroxypyruvate isomerase
MADNPGRHEPGTGEINYPFLFCATWTASATRAGSAANTSPPPTTEAGLGWLTALAL